MERKYYIWYSLFNWFTSLPGLHHEFNDVTVVEKIAGLFKKKDIIVKKTNLRSIFMYSEDGITFYEFFSGRYIGEMRTDSPVRRGRLLVRGDCILSTFDDYGTLDYDIKSLTASEFADMVKPYTPYFDHVASEMSNFLDHIDAAWMEKKHYETSAQRAKEQAEKDSQSWLDSIMNSRK